MSILVYGAALALAVKPLCGGAPRGSEFAARLAATAIHESGGNTLAIGVNPDPGRNFPGGAVQSATPQQAAGRARALIAQGRSIDLGLMQINSHEIARHGLTVEDAFDECKSMKAGAEHFAGDVRAAVIFQMAHSRYNTGTFYRGAGYAASIDQVLARFKTEISPVAAPAALERAGELFKRPGDLFVRAGKAPDADARDGDDPRPVSNLHGG